MAQYVAGSVALNTVPPVTLPPCINLSFTGFQILEPCGGVNAPPYFHVAGANGALFPAPPGRGGNSPPSFAARPRSGKWAAAGGWVGVVGVVGGAGAGGCAAE